MGGVALLRFFFGVAAAWEEHDAGSKGKEVGESSEVAGSLPTRSRAGNGCGDEHRAQMAHWTGALRRRLSAEDPRGSASAGSGEIGQDGP